MLYPPGRRFCLLLLASLLPTAILAERFPLPTDSDLVGNLSTVSLEPDQTLASLSQARGLGFRTLAAANPGIDPWLAAPGQTVILPTRHILPPGPREGIVINLAEFRLYAYQGGTVSIYPVGIGRAGAPSPLTQTRVTMRLESPTWYPPQSIRDDYARRGEELPPRVPPGPDNPLGQFALQLGDTGYLIHGTNKAFGIGTRVSYGCIRMFNRDIGKLVWETPKGTPVRIIDEPFKLGVAQGRLWLEIHNHGRERGSPDVFMDQVKKQIRARSGSRPGLTIDWQAVEQAVRRADGIPRMVGKLPDGRTRLSGK